jgi:hypothetical protein
MSSKTNVKKLNSRTNGRIKRKTKSKSKTSNKTSCKKGTIYRKGYSRATKSGSKTRVPGNCIRATSQTGKKRSLEDKRYLKEKAKSQSRARSKTRSLARSLKRCSKGQIKRTAYERKAYSRKAYTRSDGTKIKGTRVAKTVVSDGCTKDRGKSHGQGRQLFHLEKDVLKKYGYGHVKISSELQRHRALKKALVDIKPLSLFRRLNALYVLNKNQDPDSAELFKEDRNYVRTTSEYKNRHSVSSSEISRSKTKSKSKRTNKSKSKRTNKSKSKRTNKSKSKRTNKSKSKRKN